MECMKAHLLNYSTYSFELLVLYFKIAYCLLPLLPFPFTFLIPSITFWWDILYFYSTTVISNKKQTNSDNPKKIYIGSGDRPGR